MHASTDAQSVDCRYSCSDCSSYSGHRPGGATGGFLSKFAAQVTAVDHYFVVITVEALPACQLGNYNEVADSNDKLYLAISA